MFFFYLSDSGHLELTPGVEHIHHKRVRGTRPHLGGSEAKGGGVGVRALSVL